MKNNMNQTDQKIIKIFRECNSIPEDEMSDEQLLISYYDTTQMSFIRLEVALQDFGVQSVVAIENILEKIKCK